MNISFQRGCRWDGDGEGRVGGWVWGSHFFNSPVFLDADMVTLSQAQGVSSNRGELSIVLEKHACLCRASRFVSAKNPKEQHI